MAENTAVTAAEKLPQWDLASYYGTKGDPIETQLKAPEIARDINQARNRANVLRNTYKNKNLLATLDGDALAGVIKEYEAITELLAKPFFFARLAQITNLKNDAVKKEVGRIHKIITKIEGELVFFPAELKRMDKDGLEAKMASSPALKAYQPWLDKLRAYIPYQRDDAREEELHATEFERHTQWIDLYDEKFEALQFPMPNSMLTSEHRQKYGVTDEAGQTLITGVEAKGYMMGNPDEASRKAAFDARVKVYGEHAQEFADIFNKLGHAKATEEMERGFHTPLDSRNLFNEVEGDVIDGLIKTVRSGYSDTSHRYYALKARVLGKSKLDLWDINAPPPVASDRHISWEEAKTTILDAVREVSPEMARAAQQYFDNGWIDAEPRAGKPGGAFCEAVCKSAPPALLMNYQYKLKDVITLAHELGHGINMMMVKNRHSQLMADVDKSPTTTAEVPSTFIEEVVFKAVLNKAQSDDEKIELLMNRIDGLSSLIIRQTAFHVFEENVHTHIRAEHEAAQRDPSHTIEDLSPEALGKMWMAAMRESYGPSVKMDERFKNEWMIVGHFFHEALSVHAYAFASMMSGKLHAQVKPGDKEMEAKLIDLFTDLPVKHHSEVMAPFGLDARDPAFWPEGLDLYKQYVGELEKLLDKKRAETKGATMVKAAQQKKAGGVGI